MSSKNVSDMHVILTGLYNYNKANSNVFFQTKIVGGGKVQSYRGHGFSVPMPTPCPRTNNGNAHGGPWAFRFSNKMPTKCPPCKPNQYSKHCRFNTHIFIQNPTPQNHNHLRELHQRQADHFSARPSGVVRIYDCFSAYGVFF